MSDINKTSADCAGVKGREGRMWVEPGGRSHRKVPWGKALEGGEGETQEALCQGKKVPSRGTNDQCKKLRPWGVRMGGGSIA